MRGKKAFPCHFDPDNSTGEKSITGIKVKNSLTMDKNQVKH